MAMAVLLRHKSKHEKFLNEKCLIFMGLTKQFMEQQF